MKKILSFIKKNYILIILSFVYPMIMLTNIGFLGNIRVGYDELGPTDVYDIFLVFIVPISSFIYGIITYLITKKALVPNFISAIIYFVCFSVISLPDYFDALVQIFFFTLFPIIFSLSGSGITAFICMIVKGSKGEK